MDAVDAVLVELDEQQISTVAALAAPYPDGLRHRLNSAIKPQQTLSLHEFATLDIEVGRHFAKVATLLLNKAGIDADSIIALGSHGQTLRHNPRSDVAYSLQIGNAATIAARCRITTVADFRAMDIAYGGEGAPLVPAFHAWRLRSSEENRVVLNIGGIANISLLPADPAAVVSGYDTGPGNCLMDEWCNQHLGQAFDVDGRWAAAGKVSQRLLASFLSDPYFRRAPPKSTGREVLNLVWIAEHLAKTGLHTLPAEDVQATLAQLTVESIGQEIERADNCRPERIFVCGGGARNGTLLNMLEARLPGIRVTTTAEFGLDPDMVEATTFAWLAYMRVGHRPVAVTTTSASRQLLLGAVYEPSDIPGKV